MGLCKPFLPSAHLPTSLALAPPSRQLWFLAPLHASWLGGLGERCSGDPWVPLADTAKQLLGKSRDPVPFQVQPRPSVSKELPAHDPPPSSAHFGLEASAKRREGEQQPRAPEQLLRKEREEVASESRRECSGGRGKSAKRKERREERRVDRRR